VRLGKIKKSRNPKSRNPKSRNQEIKNQEIKKPKIPPFPVFHIFPTTKIPRKKYPVIAKIRLISSPVCNAIL